MTETISELFSIAHVWIKAVHLIAVISWMAGLLYLPRLFVYHCNPSNSKDLLSQPDIDGGLVGGASLDSDAFGAIIGSCTS